MTLLLAPMEGLLDFTLRDVLTRAGGIDRCVSEFIRVTDTLLPERVFHRIVPELLNGGCTPAGVPVRAQLLGSDPACLAENAARLAGLGPAGIDLNFGCPAKIVNRHGGGAALLDDPELLTRIVAAVRRAVPAGMPVSAKMRLGTQDDSRAVECAQALVEGGAGELVVHARTKAQAYRPPAYWERIADIRAAVAVPVVANGEIWSVADALRCRELSGCDDLMLGRGMVADPGLALAVATALRGAGSAPEPGPPLMDWYSLLDLLRVFSNLVQQHISPRHQAGRLKQWLNLLRRRYPEAEAAHAALRTVNDAPLLAQRLFSEPWGGAGGGRYTSPLLQPLQPPQPHGRLHQGENDNGLRSEERRTDRARAAAEDA
ncbi:MAG TPA: tRNA-dihydrouridine synthase [Ideonella sp.]|nr:tRNA-dihydrouridine synthase [Ideonella sp.]